MSIIRPTRILENEKQLLEVAGLLVGLRKSMDELYPETSPDIRQWATEQALMRLSLRDGHEFG